MTELAVAVGANYSGETDVAGWKDMAEVSAGLNHTVGLPASSEPSAEAFAANGKETIFG